MQRDLDSFPLAPIMKSKLAASGFLTVADVSAFKPSELAKVLSIDVSDALELHKFLRGHGDVAEETTGGKLQSEKIVSSKLIDNGNASDKISTVGCYKLTAWDLMNTESNFIVSFCQSIDNLLGGGVLCGKMTEFAGAPGVGKTQLCIQLAVDVQIPECFGGEGGEAFYIDTEGSFIVERVVDIAQAMVQHCQFMASADKESSASEIVKRLSVESILSGIHYVRCDDQLQLIATVHLLERFLRDHPRIKIIIIDSIAFPFRCDFEDFSARTRMLNFIAQTLNKTSVTHNLAVVLTNQMTTRFGGGSTGETLVPALGESWGHSCAIRVILRWDGQRRYARVYKSPWNQESEAAYQITTDGVRDIIPTENGGDYATNTSNVSKNLKLLSK